MRSFDEIILPLATAYPHDPHLPIRGECALWRAVIVQALMDAASHSQKPELIFHKHEALSWLTGGGRDFSMVCECAGFDPSYVRRKVKQALLAGCKWRAEPGEGRRREIRREKKIPAEIAEDGDGPSALILPFPAERRFA